MDVWAKYSYSKNKFKGSIRPINEPKISILINKNEMKFKLKNVFNVVNVFLE